MRIYGRYLVGFLGALLLAAIPALAGGSAQHADSTNFVATTTVTFGTTRLEPGNYVIRGTASQSQLEILQHNKVIATVPCRWIQLEKKAKDSQIISNDNRVTEVQFQGRMEAAEIGS
jgi:hypothetical protein